MLLAACGPAEPPVNPVQTAMSLTLAARPPASATPLLTETLDLSAPPRGKIAYVCQFSKLLRREQICLINADGSGLRVLTPAGSYDDFFPSVTPDGSLIVFYGISNGEEYPSNHDIWLMERDGANTFQLTNLAGGGWDPVWSPDGTQILFASQVRGVPQLFIIDADGTGLRQVTDLAGVRGRNDWSADGITLSTYIGESWNREIYVFDTQGENLRQLTDGGNNLAPSFSPDGRWITFMSYRDHPSQALGCEIYIMRVDGTDARRLTDNDICDWQPRWGP